MGLQNHRLRENIQFDTALTATLWTRMSVTSITAAPPAPTVKVLRLFMPASHHLLSKP